MLKSLKNKLRPYLPRNLPRTLQSLKEKDCAHTHIISFKPAVVYLTWGKGRDVIHDEMKGRRLTLLYVFYWALMPEEIIEVSRQVRETLKRHPQHRVVMACNEPHTVDLFRAQGVEAAFCSQNCLLNENTFFVDETVEKKYDAIYNANMAVYKRHLLAAKIKSLALITFRYVGTYENNYDQEVQNALAHATWLVDARNDAEKATAAQICRYCNESRVGLCLSDVEGAMYASIEYLLCGLPVVTTRNIGGRDVFFDPDYVEWVDDDPEAVNQGVINLIARAPSASVIRARTLQKMEQHRQYLRDIVRDDVPHLDIPWRPVTDGLSKASNGKVAVPHGPLMFRNLRELGKMLRQA